MRILTLLAVLLSSVVHAQAVRPAPAPAAAPPPRPGATYAPAGGGASHGGLATPEAAVPRSPNKRLLPPTKEAGLWAADGAPVAASTNEIFGAVVPLPQHPPLGADHLLGVCAADMTAAMRAVRMDKMLAFPDDVRRCLAARAYFQCALREGMSPPKRAGREVPRAWDPAYVKMAVVPLAEALIKKQCEGVTITEEQNAALNAVLEKYTWGPKDLTME